MSFAVSDILAAPLMEEPKKRTREISIWEALGMTWDILATVLILTTVFALGGVMADRYFNTKFVFTAIGFVLLVIIGRRIILKKGNRIAERLNGEPPETNKRV
jgi:F0F1-type ATP synthase assembly protein I